MTVSIQQALTADPRSGSLPLPLTLRQALSSDAPPEQAVVVYQLEAWHNICFNSDGNKTLTVQRTVTQQTAQAFADQVTLVAGSTGDPNVAILDIRQTLTDQSGLPPMSYGCTVRITR